MSLINPLNNITDKSVLEQCSNVGSSTSFEGLDRLLSQYDQDEEDKGQLRSNILDRNFFFED